MDLQSHNDTTHQQIETAKKLVKNSDSLELKKPDGYKTIDEIEQFGNLIIEHDGFLEHGFGGELEQLYENGFAPSQISEATMFITPIKNEKQTRGVKNEVKQAVKENNYTIKEVKGKGEAVIEYIT